MGKAAAPAFGWRPTLVTGLPDSFGVQYKGRTYLDIGVLAGRDKAGNTVQTLAIQMVGHETTHAQEKIRDPQDRADFARLCETVLSNTKPKALKNWIPNEGRSRLRLATRQLIGVTAQVRLAPAENPPQSQESVVDNREMNDDEQDGPEVGRRRLMGRVVQSVQMQARSMGVELGPVSAKKILEMAASGELPEMSSVEALRKMVKQMGG